MRSLVVEDDPVSRQLLLRYLSEFSECTTASSAPEALALFKEALKSNKSFDLVCLDLMMPEMSGQLALAEIHNVEQAHGIEEGKGVKIIVTTSLNDAATVVDVFQTGCEAFVTKPIAKKQLISELKKLGLYSPPN